MFFVPEHTYINNIVLIEIVLRSKYKSDIYELYTGSNKLWLNLKKFQVFTIDKKSKSSPTWISLKLFKSSLTWLDFYFSIFKSRLDLKKNNSSLKWLVTCKKKIKSSHDLTWKLKNKNQVKFDLTWKIFRQFKSKSWLDLIFFLQVASLTWLDLWLDFLEFYDLPRMSENIL